MIDNTLNGLVKTNKRYTAVSGKIPGGGGGGGYS